MKRLEGAKVALLDAGDADRSQIEAVRRALGDTGATVVLVPSELPIDRAHSAGFAALIVASPGSERGAPQADAKAVQLVREFMVAEKPVAAIGNGVFLLIAAEAAAGRTLTAPPALAPAIRDAGGDFADVAIQVDDNVITGRSTADLDLVIDRLSTLVGGFSRLDDSSADQASAQSFPASDPPPGPTSVGGARRRDGDISPD